VIHRVADVGTLAWGRVRASLRRGPLANYEAKQPTDEKALRAAALDKPGLASANESRERHGGQEWI